jgi:hypothetical protein
VEFIYLFIFLLGLFKQFWAVKLGFFFFFGLPTTYNNNTVFFVVTNMFPSSSQWVPQHVPNITTLLSHMLWQKLNFHTHIHTYISNLLWWTWMKHLFASNFWSAQCFKKFGDGPIKVTHLNFIKKNQTYFGCDSFTNKGDYRYRIISCISF